MKALTLYQPWATLVVAGIKCIETRSWKPWPGVIGQTIAIHASKTFPKEYKDMCRSGVFKTALRKAGYRDPEDLPTGAVVGTVKVIGSFEIKPVNTPDEPEKLFGDYTPGRYGWRLQEPVKYLAAKPAKGMQGLWNWNQIKFDEEGTVEV